MRFERVVFEIREWTDKQAWADRDSGMANVNEGSHSLPATHTFIYKWNETYPPLLPSRRASLNFGWYSFPVPLGVGG